VAVLHLATRVAAVAAVSLITACGQTDERHSEELIDNVWHQAKLRGVAFRAIGQEPGWLLEITNGEEILLVTDYGSARTNMPYVEPVVYQEERRTQYVLESYNTVVEIRGEPCTDTMSGESFEVTVTITIKERKLHGCGRALF
jgi:uncharacterized membrane protein